jgi:hemoglobin-like flavoprotein
MTNDQIGLVQTSFERVKPLAEEAAVLFYARLFELDPTLRPLFKNDIRLQGLKLMQTIELVVESLNRMDGLVADIGALGVRHRGYGVKDQHYETVGEALLWTLEKALEPGFTAETGEAWAAAYGMLAQMMKDAAHRSVESANIC